MSVRSRARSKQRVSTVANRRARRRPAVLASPMVLPTRERVVTARDIHMKSRFRYSPGWSGHLARSNTGANASIASSVAYCSQTWTSP